MSDNVYIMTGERLLPAFEGSGVLSFLGVPEVSAEPLVESYTKYVDYLVFATFDSPAFLENEDGAFRVDWEEGWAEYGRESIRLSCAVPRSDGAHKPPFPVVFFLHSAKGWPPTVLCQALSPPACWRQSSRQSILTADSGPPAVSF